MRTRTILRGVGVIGLALLGTGTLVYLNRDAISKNLMKALVTQTERTEATLFRWGECMSISAALKDRYGDAPDVTYDTSTSDRTLNIGFSNHRIPEKLTTEGHAREIAVFAIGQTTKFDQVDVVRVQFGATGGPSSYTFERDDLMPRHASS